METLPFPEFIIIIIIIIIIIVIFVLDYFLYASMDQCHQRIPFQKTKNALNLILKCYCAHHRDILKRVTRDTFFKQVKSTISFSVRYK